MKINADFNQRVVVHTDEIEWIQSPMPGVERRPLDRVGDEVARATTIVRYAPGSHFSPHVHTGGEEFIVLEGVFQDEHGDFPEGAYIRNPPQSKHKPGSDKGCTIFVKLWQFEPNDRTHVRLNTRYMQSIEDKNLDNISVTPLYKDAIEEVAMLTFEPNASINLNVTNGLECLVLEGELQEGKDRLRQHSWLRLPSGTPLQATAGQAGAKVWIKQGHLGRVSDEIARVTQA